MILYRISHISHGHQISVHYQYNRAGEVIAEQQRILNPEGALLWQHETLQAYSEQGQANRFKPDNLPPVIHLYRRQTACPYQRATVTEIVSVWWNHHVAYGV